ncbi:hypothetical protein MKEN_00992300 [Mycena kentingensis (nom. inval.)]|nr:hypothetical protein MKEN_00992300 [Mycena kentingensis (nom. inval.)]
MPSIFANPSALVASSIFFLGGIARTTSGAFLPRLYAYQLAIAPARSLWLALTDFAAAGLLIPRRTRPYAAGILALGMGNGFYTAYSEGLEDLPLAGFLFAITFTAFVLNM